jgi:redox-sensitive bicupin YhaK (pirin superfamily)
MSTFRSEAYRAVITGDFIPAHDETTDLAESIGEQLDAFRAYVASVRDAEQAEAATAELLTALLMQVQQPEHTFRVIHEHSGKVAYDGPSFTAAGGTQYRLNVEESAERREPLWRMWIVDIDGVSCTVNTQQETR